MREFGLFAREGKTERRFPRCGRDFGVRAGAYQQWQQRDRARSIGIQREVQRRAALRIARVRIGAEIEQTSAEIRVGIGDHKMQRAALAGRSAAPIAATIEQITRECTHRIAVGAVRRQCQHARDQTGAADRCSSAEPLRKRFGRRWQRVDQTIKEVMPVTGPRFAAESAIEQPGSGLFVLDGGQIEVEVGKRDRWPVAEHAGELGSHIPVRETQRIEQMIGIGSLRRRQSTAEAARQWVGGIQQGNDMPTPRGGGVVERARTLSSLAWRDWQAMIKALRSLLSTLSTLSAFGLRLPSAWITATAPDRAASINAVVPR